MSSPFTITTVSNAIPLDASRRGLATFTVTNATVGPIQGRADLVAVAPAEGGWLAIEGLRERSFAVEGTEQVTVRVQVPANALPGRYMFGLDMVGVENPDELFSEGPRIAFEVVEPSRPPRRFLWWIVAVAAGVLVTAAIIVIAVLLMRKVPVPVVYNMPVDSARAMLEAGKLRVGDLTTVPDATVAPGRVVNTTPGPGTEVKKGSAVMLVLSGGPPLPTAAFEYVPPSGTAPLRVVFTDRSEGVIAGWKWNFGDGGTSIVQSPVYTYNKAGSYTVTLTVVNAGGSNTTQDSVLVYRPWSVVSWIGPFGGPFGDWSQEEMCPEGQWVFAMSLRVESSQHGGDDTALNSIRLTCGMLGYGKEIQAAVGQWGDWSPRQDCLVSNYITGVRLRIEPSLGGGDDTGGVDAEFYCQDGATLRGKTHHEWGEWKPVQSCPPGTAICGIKTRVESNQHGGDDTAMNDAQFACCWLP